MPQYKTIAEVFNVVMADADTEYSQLLPFGTKSIRFQARTAASIRYAFVTGKVATPTAPYMTLKSGGIYETIESLELTINAAQVSQTTLFLASASAAITVEIEVWR